MQRESNNNNNGGFPARRWRRADHVVVVDPTIDQFESLDTNSTTPIVDSAAPAFLPTTPPPSGDRFFPANWRAFQRPVAPRPRPQPVPLEITMNIQEGETYSRTNLVGTNVPGDVDVLPPVIFVTDGGTQFMALSRTMRYSRPIPITTGFTYIDILRMASILQVTAPWLAVQITSYEVESNGWNAGPHVADLANLHDLVNNNNNPAEAQAILSRVRTQVEAHAVNNNNNNNLAVQALDATTTTAPPRLILISTTDDDVSDDEVCTICMESSADTPGMGWSFAQGCASHPFHTDCIQQWGGRACILCRAPLAVRASIM